MSSLPSQQKALALLAKQGEWGIIDVEVDKPGPGEVLIRLEAAGLNPLEWKVQAYGLYVTKFPAIIGADCAGVVAAIGEGVSTLSVGDRVVHQGNYEDRLAAFKQYTIAPADIVAKIPDNISFDQAATLPICVGAAMIGMYGKKQHFGGAGLVAPWQEGGRGKYVGQPIFVFGGSTTVGQFVIQLAKLSGFSPIIATASAHNTELVKSIGATHVIDRNLSTDKIIETAKKITSDSIQVVYDSVSQKATQNAGYDILSSGGTLVITTPRSVDEDKIISEKTIVNTSGTIHRDFNRDLGKQFYSNLSEYLRTGDLKPPSVESLPEGLAGIPKGLERLRSGQVSGRKLVAHPQETV